MVGVGVERGIWSGRGREALYVMAMDVHGCWRRSKTGLDVMCRMVNRTDIDKPVTIPFLVIVYRSKHRLSHPCRAARSRGMFSWSTSEPRRELLGSVDEDVLDRLSRRRNPHSSPTLGGPLASGRS